MASFDCGDKGPNDFFSKDAQAHKDQLLAETYVLLQKKAGGLPVALLGLSNDVIRLKKLRGKLQSLRARGTEIGQQLKLAVLAFSKRFRNRT